MREVGIDISGQYGAGWRDHKPVPWALGGAVVLVLYGVIFKIR